MTAGRRALLLAAAWLAVAPSVAAREPDDPRLPSWQQSHLVEGNPLVRTLRAFAYCTVRLRTAEVEALLATRFGSAEEMALVRTIAGEGPNRCVFRRDLHFRDAAGMALFRGVNAEFLYNKDVPGSRRYTPRPGPPAGDGDGYLGGAVADCAVRRAPNEVHALLRFNHDSPGETRMLRALRPVLLACLPADRSLPASRYLMRAMLAEALYHFSREE